MSDTYTNENDKIPCRLRVKGAFFVKGGVKQVCTMLNQTINITFGDELVFRCAECPDPAKRDKLLELNKDRPMCAYCGKNMATEAVPRDVTLIRDEPTIRAGAQLCISCYAGANYQYKNDSFQQWQQQYEQLEREYKDGKIPYSQLVEFKKKFEDENPGTIMQ